ncbi:MAG: COQ9 family protein [Albidovulum sp.]
MEKNSTDMAGLRARLLDAALEHVAFDGWSVATFAASVADTGVDPGLAKALFPRGALDMAVAYHKRGDALMVDALSAQDPGALRFRDRVALAVRLRLEVAEREAVRRGAALFALPQNLATGAGLIWGTADAIWRALGDNSQDINWYSKRASLSAVYSATVLYWLGDSSEDHEASWEFLDRRIEEVMRFEKTKADLRASPLAKVLAGPLGLLGRIRAPAPVPDDLPGKTSGKTY